MGTPKIADEILKALLKDNTLEVVGVVTQPDKPVGRKKKLTPPLVKITALNNSILVFQPEKLRKNREIEEKLKELNPDFLLVVAYGQILPSSVLKIPLYEPINIHASLLPKYRGASPIQSALLNNDKKTGITLMRMNNKMDEGDIFLKREVVIEEEDNYLTLENKLINISINMLNGFFKDIISGKLKPKPQNHKEAIYCKKIVKEDGLLNFNEGVKSLIGKIRAYVVWPKSYFKYDKKIYTIIEAKGIESNHDYLPGTIKIDKKSMKIYVKDGYLDIKKIQPQAKKIMPVSAFFNGNGKFLNDKVVDNNYE